MGVWGGGGALYFCRKTPPGWRSRLSREVCPRRVFPRILIELVIFEGGAYGKRHWRLQANVKVFDVFCIDVFRLCFADMLPKATHAANCPAPAPAFVRPPPAPQVQSLFQITGDAA